MSSDKVILMPAISYTVANAKKDIGNLDVNLSNYVKKETLEIIIESLVSDEELAEKLKDYVNKVFMNNALDDYVTKVLLNEKINNFTTYAYVQDVIDNVSTITDQMLAIETTLTNKSDVGHTHTTADITDIGTSITTKKINVNTPLENGFPIEVRYNGSLGRNKFIRYLIGDNTAQALFGYGHDDSNVPYSYMNLYKKKASVIVYSDNIKLDGQTSCTNTLTASNIKADNETRLATCETNIDSLRTDLETLIETKINEAKETIINDAFKEIYPIGSIYVSTSLLSEDVKYDYNLSQYYVLWHGCEWKFMDEEFFLRNSLMNIEYGRDETITFSGIGDKGYVSVTDSYTNSYPYLSVCMYKRIA